MTTSTPLPPNPYLAGPWHNAYAICLDFEARSRSQLASGRFHLMCARLLGYMILHAPVVKGRDNFSNEVADCACDDDLEELAQTYIGSFIRCFRAAKGRTPGISEHPSRPSLDDAPEMLQYLLLEAPKSHETAKQLALIRDGYCCRVSGLHDLSNPKRPFPGRLNKTQAAHIFPEPNIAEVDEGGPNHDYAAPIWTVMERFGDILLTEELKGADIHRLENIITMDPTVHYLFDRLEIWLEPDPNTSNRYFVRAVAPELLQGLSPSVTFTTPDERLALPSPRYLRLHAACARVAHLSGAGEYIEATLQKLEGMPVLSKDGSSADILSGAMLRIFVR